MTLIPNFETLAFVDGAQFEGRPGHVQTIRVHCAGDIEFGSGRVIVADAGATEFATYPALENKAPSGKYPVYVSIIEGSEGAADVAVAWVKFSDQSVHHWHPAYYEGHEADDHYDPGFGVDTGTACIADAEVAATLDTEEAGTRLLDALLEGYDQTPPLALFHPDAPGRFFVSSSGMGDGFYTSYWGTDAELNPVFLAVDFEMLTVPEWESFELTLPLTRGTIRNEITEAAGAKLDVPLLPLWGAKKLRWQRGRRMPRVRLFRDGELVEHISPTFHLNHADYVVKGEPEDTLEVSFIKSYRAAEPIIS